jgi:hypothetical protein
MIVLTRGRAVAARVAHNHKVAGSSPAPATKKRVSTYVGAFFLMYIKIKFNYSL